MNTDRLTELFEQPTGHPSEYELDRLHLGESEPSEATRAHLQACEHCRSRMELRRQGLDAFPDLDARGVLARLQAAHASTPESLGARFRAWLSQFRYPAGALVAAAAVLALFVLSRDDARRNDPDEFRSKGDGISLRVFKSDGERAIEQLSGDTFHPGDRIRFVVNVDGSPESPTQLIVLGVERSGSRSIYYPPSGEPTSAPPEIRDDGSLAGAIELDDYLGDEWLYLIACPEPFTADDVSDADETGELQVPAGCRWQSFRMSKQ